MMDAAIRAAIQAMLDRYGDGWQVAQFVVALGLEKVGPDGDLESIPWVYAPTGQPDWQTDGLLEAAIDLRHGVDIDD